MVFKLFEISIAMRASTACYEDRTIHNVDTPYVDSLDFPERHRRIQKIYKVESGISFAEFILSNRQKFTYLQRGIEWDLLVVEIVHNPVAKGGRGRGGGGVEKIAINVGDSEEQWSRTKGPIRIAFRAKVTKYIISRVRVN